MYGKMMMFNSRVKVLSAIYYTARSAAQIFTTFDTKTAIFTTLNPRHLPDTLYMGRYVECHVNYTPTAHTIMH